MKKSQNFKTELEALRRHHRITTHPHSIERYEERWSMLDKVKTPRSAAGTEKLVAEFLVLKGHMSAKVSTQGTYIKGETYTTASGGKITGQGKYIKSGARKGQADLNSSIYGIAVAWELKFSKGDRQSPEQKKFQKEMEESGGIYIIFKSIDDFYEKYYQLLEYPQIKLMKDYYDSNPNQKQD